MNIMEKYVENCGKTFANSKVTMRNLMEDNSEDSLKEYWNRRNAFAITLIESINMMRKAVK